MYIMLTFLKLVHYTPFAFLYCPIIDDAKNSKDKKRAKKYSDIRSAIKKYRDFIEERNNSSH